MTTISAMTVLRSRNAAAPDEVLSTLLLRYPRPIHSEFMTHKMLSKNSASSRAIPTKKLIQSIKDDPFVPLSWGKNQKGMQAGEEHDALVEIFDQVEKRPLGHVRERAWLTGMHQMLDLAESFDKAGYHKQIVNRLIEPWMHITVLASGMDKGKGGWSNFIGLRDHEAAEPHIQILAREIRKCLERDDVQTLQPGQWHTPFVDSTIEDDGVQSFRYEFDPLSLITTQDARKISVARCASTSYLTVEGQVMTLERAIPLFDKFVKSRPLHASPFEHVAQADEGRLVGYMDEEVMSWDHPEEHGNFVGFRQLRKQLPGECIL